MCAGNSWVLGWEGSAWKVKPLVAAPPGTLIDNLDGTYQFTFTASGTVTIQGEGLSTITMTPRLGGKTCVDKFETTAPAPDGDIAPVTLFSP